jgi:3-hydroxyisobutyrate dehydrogenase-like beta-hydroxyacid dehydrogenase
MARVAVVGLGAMGSRIARRLNADVVWNRTREKAEEYGDAHVADSPADAAEEADVVITMVRDADALRDVTERDDGIASTIGDKTLIEMSTVGPAAIERLAQQIPNLIDAPVLGSTTEVEEGKLKIFAAGDAHLVERHTPLLSKLGEVIYVGPQGNGARAKLVANSTLFGSIGVFGEALALADALGIERDKAWQVLGATPMGQQAERRRPAVEANDYPPRFALSLARKDAELVTHASDADLRIAEAARSWLAEAEEAGLGDEDYSAVLKRILQSGQG